MKYLTKNQRAQSFVEMALFMPILLLLLSGMVEVTFMFNDYLQLLDAVRYGARDISDNNPYPVEFPVVGGGFSLDTTVPSSYDRISKTAGSTEKYAGYVVWDCNNTLNFFATAACNTDNNLSYLRLTKDGNARNNCSGTPKNTTFRDDIVVSLFATTYISTTGTPGTPELKRFSGNKVAVVGTKYAGLLSDDLNPSTSNAMSSNDEDLDDSGWSYLGQMCSAFTKAQIATKLINTTPSTGFVLVEVFYGRHKTLDFPFVGDLIPNPIPLHAYAIFPLVTIEPTKTPIP